MENTISGFAQPKTEAEAKLIIDQLFAEMGKLRDTMRRDQVEIDLLRAETLRLKTDTRATLDRISKLI